ncbi:hypothetical protein JW698_01350, partial [Candidatus Wolfebacteria bacterium]|nr:hypothetical protein [Candidatus Wolfebacteria bacterium]
TIIDKFNQNPAIGGTSIELIDFDGQNLKLKLNCPNQDMFKIEGKLTSFTDQTKKFVEKYIKEKIGEINVIFI